MFNDCYFVLTLLTLNPSVRYIQGYCPSKNTQSRYQARTVDIIKWHEEM